MVQEAIQYIPLEKIECHLQVREHFAEQQLVGLARSIQEIGLQQPIRLRRDGPRLVVVDGERRLRACRLAKLPAVAAIIEEKSLCEAEVLQRQLVANLQRSDLSPCERARGIKKLIEATDWPTGQAAAKCGLSGSMATKLLSVLTLPESIQAQVNSGAVAISAAYELAGVADPQAQAALAQQMANGQLTRDGLIQTLKSRRRDSTAKRPESGRRVVAVLSKGHSVTVIGAEPTLGGFIGMIEQVLTKANRARGEGGELKAFLRMLRVEANASSRGRQKGAH